uniref:Deoxyribonuclease II n=1 Tax=Rhipicephalus appendiculatus TaxID=34631 RepID=A0A131YSC4_RHIAP
MIKLLRFVTGYFAPERKEVAMIFVPISVSLRLSLLCWSVNTALGKGEISCKNAAGQDVDWFVVYKLPKTQPNNRFYWTPNGEEMAYYGSDSQMRTWEMLPSSIYHKKFNPIWETLKPAYGKQSKVAYACYNDQPPDKFGGTRGGHSKGVLMASDNGVGGTVWLQHSVPRFVDDLEKSYFYPPNGRENGQLFLCISFHLNTVETIASHLQVQAAHVYNRRLRPWVKKFPTFWKLLNKTYMRDPNTLKIDVLWTRAGRRVLAVAKSPRYARDIYTHDMMAAMKDSIIVQSWKNGKGGAQDSFCGSKYTVTDTTFLHIGNNAKQAYFSTREDHSKWYVTKTKAIFCFSSLNRMCSQRSRGGEITCLEDFYLARLFRNSIAESSTCKGFNIRSALKYSKLMATCS